ncbi:MAG: glycine cleavage system aminomethyltransferase GcvT [Saccharofermentanales bacterium]|jgi:aminomethyltransferase
MTEIFLGTLILFSEEDGKDMKKTPLNDRHRKLGARMVDYAGWEMPVQYEGIVPETAAVRQKCGLFDVSHMGEILVTGGQAGSFLDWLLTRRVTDKAPDQITYAIMCYNDGGVVDDLLVYPADSGYLLVVNAANKDKDLLHLADSLNLFRAENNLAADAVGIEDHSDRYAQIAIQGPESKNYMQTVSEILQSDAETAEAISVLKRFRCLLPDSGQHETATIISRTGYTGEDGFEIYGQDTVIWELWDALVSAGCTPCGLGARDALRFEACLPLYGHEMSETINPLDAGLDFFVNFDREFQGDKMQKTRKLVRLINPGKQIPRDGYPVFQADLEVGYITSGGFSPTLGRGIANALVIDNLVLGPELIVEIRGKQVPFKIVDKFLPE